MAIWPRYLAQNDHCKCHVSEIKINKAQKKKGEKKKGGRKERSGGGVTYSKQIS